MTQMADEAPAQGMEAAAAGIQALLRRETPAKTTPPTENAKVEGDDAATKAAAESDAGQTVTVEGEASEVQDSEEVEQPAEESSEALSLDDVAKRLGVSDVETLLDRLQIEVKVDGKAETKNLREVVQDHAREADYTRKTTKHAEERKAWEASRATAEKEQRERAQFLYSAFSNLHSTIVGPEPDPALRQTDPQEYATQLTLHADNKAQFDKLMAPVVREIKKQRETADQKFEEFKREQREALMRDVPQLADAGTQQKLASYLLGAGLTKDDLTNLHYAPAYKLAYKAMLYDDAQSGKALQDKKAKTPAPKVLKPGAAQDAKATASARVKELSAQAKKSGSTEDTARLLDTLMRRSK